MGTELPDWFKLIKAWRDQGHYGLTLPFIVGAIALRNGSSVVERGEIESLLKQMIEGPVTGFIVHIRWCMDYQSTVFTVYEEDSIYRLYDKGVEIRNATRSEPVIVFEKNLAARWGLPHDSKRLIAALIDEAAPLAQEGRFSKFWTENGREYGPFQDEDINFIHEILEMSSS